MELFHFFNQVIALLEGVLGAEEEIIPSLAQSVSQSVDWGRQHVLVVFSLNRTFRKGAFQWQHIKWLLKR